MSFLSRFFAPFPDDRQGNGLGIQALALGLIFLGVLWFGTRLTTATGVWSVFVGMSLFVLIVYALDFVFENNANFNNALESVGIGRDKDILPAVAIGAALGFVFISRQSLIPLSLTFSDGFTQFAFVKFFSPLVEEYFFRGVGIPTFIANLKQFLGFENAAIVSVLVSAVAFAVFHQGDFAAHFAFGILAAVLMYATKSIAAPLSLHFIVNWFS